MTHAIMLNVIGLLALAGLIALLTFETRDRWLGFMILVWYFISASIVCWVLYAIGHFIHKYW